jgi:hypothetical protein
VTKEEEAALIAKRQADCTRHKQVPNDTFIGKPAQCAFCGMLKSKYELSLAPNPYGVSGGSIP